MSHASPLFPAFLRISNIPPGPNQDMDMKGQALTNNIAKLPLSLNSIGGSRTSSHAAMSICDTVKILSWTLRVLSHCPQSSSALNPQFQEVHNSLISIRNH